MVGERVGVGQVERRTNTRKQAAVIVCLHHQKLLSNLEKSMFQSMYAL